MKIGLIPTIIVLTINCFAGQPREISELKKIFEKYKVDGSILIYDSKENAYIGYNLERCNIAFCPTSTFKIPNTLIALESGIFSIDSVFK